MKEHEKRNILVESIYLGYFFEGSYGLSKFLTVYCSTDETWCARRANPACKVHAAQGGRKLGEKLVKFRSLDQKC